MMYASPLYYREPIIDEHFHPEVQPTVDGVPKGRGLIPRDLKADPLYSFAAPLPIPVIPRDEWRERVEELDRRKARLSDLWKRTGIRCKDQQQTKYCWIFAATSSVEVNRAQQNQPYVSLSPASAGAPIQNYRNEGGWSTKGLRYIAQNGVAPTENWPDAAIDRTFDNAESREARKAFIVPEWWECNPRNFDELATCLLSGFAVACGYNWWGHATVALDLVAMPNGRWGTRGLNSWGEQYGEGGLFILSGGREVADDAVVPRVST